MICEYKTRKLSYRKDDFAMHPIYSALKIFQSLWVRPRLLFPKFLMGFCCDRSFECAYKNLKFVAIPLPEIIGIPKKLGIPWICPRCLFFNIFNGFCSDGPCECTSQTWSPYSFALSWENSNWSFGGCEPPILGKRRPYRSRRWYHSKERWWLPIGLP